MAKDMREELQKILASNTFVARLVAGSDVKSLPGNKIDILMDDELTVSSYIQVPVLPLPKDAKEGVFYILPNSSINFIINGQWESVFPTDEVIKKVKKADGTALPVDTSDMSVTLPQDDLSDGFYFTTETLTTDVGTTQDIPFSSMASFDKADLVLNETSVYDANGTVAVAVDFVDNLTLRVKTMTYSVDAAGTKVLHIQTGHYLSNTVGDVATVPVANIDGWVYNEALVDMTQLYDEDGRIGVLASKTATVATIKTITPRADDAFVLHTTEVIDNKRNAETVIAWSDITETILVKNLTIGATLVYDDNGALARLKYIDATNHAITVETIMHSDWAGNSFYTAELSTIQGSSNEINIVDVANYDADVCVPYRSFLYDNYGTFGIITDKSASKLTYLTLGGGTNPVFLRTNLVNFTPSIGWETGIQTSLLSGWQASYRKLAETGKNLFVLDSAGTMAIVTGYNSAAGQLELKIVSIKHTDTLEYDGVELYDLQDSAQVYIPFSSIRIWRSNTGSTDVCQTTDFYAGRVITDSRGNTGVIDYVDTAGSRVRVTKHTTSWGEVKVVNQTFSRTIGDTVEITVSKNPYRNEWTKNKTFLIDSDGTLGLVTNIVYPDASNMTATVRTISTNKTTPVCRWNSNLNETIGGTATVSISNLTKVNNLTQPTEEEIVFGETLIVDPEGRVGTPISKIPMVSPAQYSVRTILNVGDKRVHYFLSGDYFLSPSVETATVSVQSSQITDFPDPRNRAFIKDYSVLVSDRKGTIGILYGENWVDASDHSKGTAMSVKVISKTEKLIFNARNTYQWKEQLDATTTVSASVISNHTNINWDRYRPDNTLLRTENGALLLMSGNFVDNSSEIQLTVVQEGNFPVAYYNGTFSATYHGDLFNLNASDFKDIGGTNIGYKVTRNTLIQDKDDNIGWVFGYQNNFNVIQVRPLVVGIGTRTWRLKNKTFSKHVYGNTSGLNLTDFVDERTGVQADSKYLFEGSTLAYDKVGTLAVYAKNGNWKTISGEEYNSGTLLARTLYSDVMTISNFNGVNPVIGKAEAGSASWEQEGPMARTDTGSEHVLKITNTEDYRVWHIGFEWGSTEAFINKPYFTNIELGVIASSTDITDTDWSGSVVDKASLANITASASSALVQGEFRKSLAVNPGETVYLALRGKAPTAAADVGLALNEFWFAAKLLYKS